MIFSLDLSQATNTFFGELKLVNSLIFAASRRLSGTANRTPGSRQRALPGRRAPATSRVNTTTPRGREKAMKTATNSRTGTRAAVRSSTLALLLAATLGSGSHAANAAQSPSAAELERCLHRAGLELKLDGHDLRLLSAQKFALGRERHMIALNTEIALGNAAMNPRLYCTVERGGEISLLQTMPRLPHRPPAALVAR
jgi:hypothetical protein